MRTFIILFIISVFLISCKKEENLHSAPKISIEEIYHTIDNKEFTKKEVNAFAEQGKNLNITFNVNSAENLQQINVYSTDNDVVDFSEFPNGLYGETYKLTFDEKKKDIFNIPITNIQQNITISVMAHDVHNLVTSLSFPINLVAFSPTTSDITIKKNQYFNINTKQGIDSSLIANQEKNLILFFDGEKMYSPKFDNGNTTAFIDTTNVLSATELAYQTIPLENDSIIIQKDKKYIYSTSNNKKGIIEIQKVENNQMTFDLIELHFLD